MNSARKVRSMIVVAIALIFPFALLEVYVVLKFGFLEPYSYWYSVPSAIISFFVLQFAVCYSCVKGWRVCNMSRNYGLLGLWGGSLVVLFALPWFFGWSYFVSDREVYFMSSNTRQLSHVL